MWGKIPDDKRMFTNVYLENTHIPARFQYTQRHEAELCEEEKMHRRAVAFKYVSHEMVEGLHCYLEIIQNDEKEDYHRWKDFNIKTWDIDMLGGLPQQEDRTSSGLFMLKYMEHWNGGRRAGKGAYLALPVESWTLVRSRLRSSAWSAPAAELLLMLGVGLPGERVEGDRREPFPGMRGCGAMRGEGAARSRMERGRRE
uniref:Uncharacterized protein n=1 Tax=Setaria italica TaxID=4555 RepID=K3XQR1_SETIT